MHDSSTNIVNAVIAIVSSKIDTVIIDYSFYSLIIIINVNYNLFNLIWQMGFSLYSFEYFDFEKYSSSCNLNCGLLRPAGVAVR